MDEKWQPAQLNQQTVIINHEDFSMLTIKDAKFDDSVITAASC